VGSSLLPHTLPDDTGYNTENNRGLETGWSTVAGGLGRVVAGNLVQVVVVAVVLVALLAASDAARSLRRIHSKAEWGTMAWYGGGAAALLGYAYGFWLMVSGQWLCLSAPERRLAKPLVFTSLLCLAAAPVLAGVGASLFLGSAQVGKTRIADPRGTVLMASGLLNLCGYVLLAFFLRACAKCFDNRPLTWLANVYLLGTVLLIAFAVALVSGLVPADLDPKAIQKAFSQGVWNGLQSLGPFAVVGAAFAASFVYYLVLIILTRNLVEHHAKGPMRVRT